MLVKIAIAFAVLVAGVLAFAATRPDTFRVQRTAGIKAPPERIYALIEDYRRWVDWSPYEKRDPDLKRTYAGAERGKGAVYAWDGRGVGQGRMETVEAAPPSKIVIKLDFVAPFEAHNLAEFSVRPDRDVTHVTWAMHGSNNYVAKVVHLFFDIDRMVGGDFEAGLANLKALAER